MIKSTYRKGIVLSLVTAQLGAGSLLLNAAEPTKAELQAKIAELEAQLAQTKAQLATAPQTNDSAVLMEEESAEPDKVPPADKITPGDIIPFLEGLKIGGAVRVNYTIGDYSDASGSGNQSRADDGAFALDTFRVNLDYARGNWVAKAEYRFYPGYGSSNDDMYHFLHTGWVGYNFDGGQQVQVGLNRVPFGPGAYGVSQSFFFDQHYYVGLSDDMDVGIKYSAPYENWQFDAALYLMSEGDWSGNNFSNDSVRYSYDVTNESGQGYEEAGQLNLRGIYKTSFDSVDAAIGASLQFGMLESQGAQDDATHYAGSVHGVFNWENWTLATQLTYFSYDVDSAQPLGSGDLVQMGAYDFASLVAAEAWIPAVSLSYKYDTDNIGWLDYVLPYVEYSSIMKTESSFNDSDLFIVGAAWARGNWYCYTDLCFSNGNDFVGNEGGYGSTAGLNPGSFTSNRFGQNPDEDWQMRFNINFGYYF